MISNWSSSGSLCACWRCCWRAEEGGKGKDEVSLMLSQRQKAKATHEAEGAAHRRPRRLKEMKLSRLDEAIKLERVVNGGREDGEGSPFRRPTRPTLRRACDAQAPFMSFTC